MCSEQRSLKFLNGNQVSTASDAHQTEKPHLPVAEKPRLPVALVSRGESTFQSINVEFAGLERPPSDGGLADVWPHTEGPVETLPAVVRGQHLPTVIVQGYLSLRICGATRDDGRIILFHDD